MTSRKKYCIQYVSIFVRTDSIFVRSVFAIVKVPPVTLVSSEPSLKIHVILASGLMYPASSTFSSMESWASMP